MNRIKDSKDSSATDSKSMSQIVFSQFIEHKFALAGLFTITVFMLIGIFAPVISGLTGLDPNVQDVFNRYKPALSTISYSSDRMDYEMEKLSDQNPLISDKIKTYLQSAGPAINSEVDFSLSTDEFLVDLNGLLNEEPEILEKFKTLKNPEIQRLLKLRESFKTTHLLGTDELGRDVLIRLVYGTRVSIGVGLLVAFASAIIGLFIGSLAGYYGGVIDTLLMRVTDSLLSLPLLPVLIIFAAVDLKKVPLLNFFEGSEQESVFKLIAILCLFSWMTVARLVRGSILSIKEQEFIQAAKTLGARDHIIIIKHIIPNVIAPLLVSVTLNIGNSILSEAALGFLGLGIQPPIPSWGNMLNNAQELIYRAPLLAILPGFLILVVVISFNFFGDGLQDAVDPKSIRR
ncbi:MAG: ABC transporter permease [Bacteriovoracaceae bacterium]|jgi:peptide/nickel transport system permease protein|nr:ABC transporter permease [Bacteriovoracaceae bacterium]